MPRPDNLVLGYQKARNSFPTKSSEKVVKVGNAGFYGIVGSKTVLFCTDWHNYQENVHKLLDCVVDELKGSDHNDTFIYTFWGSEFPHGMSKR